jgi:hypothetical protein
VNPSAGQGKARLRGLLFAVGLKPSAIQGKARLRGLLFAVGLKPSAIQGKARLRGRKRNNCPTTISLFKRQNMPMISVQAIYEHGQIRLLEKPPVQDRYRVLVTFLAPEPAVPEDRAPT